MQKWGSGQALVCDWVKLNGTSVKDHTPVPPYSNNLISFAVSGKRDKRERDERPTERV